MTDRRAKYTALLGITVFATATAFAAAPSSDVPIGAFKGPQLEHFKFDYPVTARRERHEGWVSLGFMVSSKGVPYAVTVISSSGPKELVDAAIADLEKSTFVPASLEGRPIDSGDEMQVKFTLVNVPRVIDRRSLFYRNYVRLVHAIEKKDTKDANQYLNAAEPETLTEDAFYAIARAQYAAVWGTPSEELLDLEIADLDNAAVNCLPKELVRSELLMKLGLDINLRHYVEALATWKRLQPSSLPQKVRAHFAPAIAQIEFIRDTGLGYSVTGEIGARGWALGLLEPHFSIVVSQGKMSEVRLRCQGGYLFFPFNPKLQYTVNGKYRSCAMYLVGDLGTRFTVNQF